MSRTRKFTVLAGVIGLALAPLAASVWAQSDHARHLSMNLKCLCKGCDMSAGGCSHPGGAFTGPCNVAKDMMHEVDAHIAKGETDEQIIQSFVQQYGTIVYMVPPKTGFGLVAWLMPIAYAVFGLGLVLFLIRKWRKPAMAAHGSAGESLGGSTPKVSSEALDRVKRETDDERMESGTPRGRG